MPLELLIIADDLTGAADTAAQFAKQGIGTAIALSCEDDIGKFGDDISVVAVDTESRHLPPALAFERVTKVVANGVATGCNRFYKKLDSTFRGNIGSELEALMQAAGARQLMLVPAYPKAGRTTKTGIQYVKGAPPHATSFARDQREPATESDVAAIIGRQSAIQVFAVDLASLHEKCAAPEGRNGIFVFDAQTDEDLGAIARHLAAHGALRTLAGSAGFAEVLPELFNVKHTRRMEYHFSPKLLVACGSLNDVSLGQVEHARAQGIPHLPLPSDVVASGRERGDGEPARRFAAEVARTFLASDCAVISTAYLEPSADPESISQGIASAVAQVKALIPETNLAIFGGDTAFAVARGLGYQELFPVDEILPGLTHCLPNKNHGAGAFILKSGGFGPQDVVERILKRVKGEE